MVLTGNCCSGSALTTGKKIRARGISRSEITRGRLRIERLTFVEALRAAAEHSLDWIYIDSDHRYATTRDELLLAVKKAKSDGYM